MEKQAASKSNQARKTIKNVKNFVKLTQSNEEQPKNLAKLRERDRGIFHVVSSTFEINHSVLLFPPLGEPPQHGSGGVEKGGPPLQCPVAG